MRKHCFREKQRFPSLCLAWLGLAVSGCLTINIDADLDGISDLDDCDDADATIGTCPPHSSEPPSSPDPIPTVAPVTPSAAPSPTFSPTSSPTPPFSTGSPSPPTGTLTPETPEPVTATPAPVDGDGDGYTQAQDCNDADPTVYPGAEDLPGDGQDDNCNAVSDWLVRLAGTGAAGYSGDGQSALTAQLNGPLGLAMDSAGQLYVADGYNHRIRRINSAGILSTVVGTGSAGYSGDGGLPTAARITQPFGLVMTQDGTLIFSDRQTHCIRQVKNNFISTLAGTGTAGFSGDNGVAASAKLNEPTGLAVDAAGTLYLSDTYNYRIRKVSNGIITTLIGTGSPGFSGENKLGTSSSVNYVQGLSVLQDGRLYFADQENHRVRRWDPTSQRVETVIGNGNATLPTEEGLAVSTALGYPTAVREDPWGNLYVGSLLGVVVQVRDGRNYTVAGTGVTEYQPAEGSAAEISLASPQELLLDPLDSSLLFTDGDQNVVYRLLW